MSIKKISNTIYTIIFKWIEEETFVNLKEVHDTILSMMKGDNYNLINTIEQDLNEIKSSIGVFNISKDEKFTAYNFFCDCLDIYEYEMNEKICSLDSEKRYYNAILAYYRTSSFLKGDTINTSFVNDFFNVGARIKQVYSIPEYEENFKKNSLITLKAQIEEIFNRYNIMDRIYPAILQ